ARRHLGDLPLDGLKVGDGAAELLALLRILHRRFEARATDADRLRRDADAAAVERVHRDVEALAFLAEQRRRGNTNVLEQDLGRRRATNPGLLLGFAD